MFEWEWLQCKLWLIGEWCRCVFARHNYSLGMWYSWLLMQNYAHYERALHHQHIQDVNTFIPTSFVPKGLHKHNVPSTVHICKISTVFFNSFLFHKILARFVEFFSRFNAFFSRLYLNILTVSRNNNTFNYYHQWLAQTILATTCFPVDGWQINNFLQFANNCGRTKNGGTVVDLIYPLII